MKIEFESLHRQHKGCITEVAFWDMVADCAYFKSEKKGFPAGCALADWVEAEEEVSKQCFYWFQEIE